MSLALTYARFQLLETWRIPIAMVTTVALPFGLLLFFVVPEVRGAHDATLATGAMVTFATMLSCLFNVGIGVAERRASAWDAYLRTLPAGAVPRLAGMLLASLAMVGLATVPVVLGAALLTDASASALELAGGLGALLVVAVPFSLIGLAIGCTLSPKGAVAATNLLFLPLAFGGGLFEDPRRPSALVEAVSPYLPTGGALELVQAATAGVEPDPLALALLGAWIAATAALALWAYRRDEGSRFD